MTSIRPATVVGLRLGTPIVATYLLPFTTYLAVLSYRISAIRVNSETFIGSSTKQSAEKGPQDQPDVLAIATRAHANFTENVPLALLIAAITELNGGNGKAIAGALGALLVCRVTHVELGMRGEGGKAPGRLIGHAGTLLYLLGMSGYCAYLSKGYWGF